MNTVETVKIESDERGFELHMIIGDDIEHGDDGRVVLNVHMVAEDLLRECVTKIGPWLLEGMRVKRSMARARWDAEEMADIVLDALDPKNPNYLGNADTLRDAARSK